MRRGSICSGPTIQLRLAVKSLSGVNANCPASRLLTRQSGEAEGSRKADGPGRARGRRTGAVDAKRLDVVVEGELVRMRAQPDGVHLVLPLVVDPGLDQARGEHVPLQQEVVILLEAVQPDVERARELLDLLLCGAGRLVRGLCHLRAP